MLFDVFLTDDPISVARPLVPVRLRCPACGQQSTTRLWNRRWNQFVCQHCRHSARQFMHATAATLDTVTRQVGHVSVSQYHVDWRPYGLTALCLGPHEERRVMLCLQFDVRGPTSRSVAVRWTA